MTNEYAPTFRKDEKIIDGQLVEKFYIDDCEVNQKTYYSLLEDLMDKEKNISKKISPIPIPIDVAENAILTYENEIEASTREYVNEVLIELLQIDDEEDQLDYLLNEMVFQYRQGYYVGQLELTDVYLDSNKKSKRIIRDAYEDLISEYED